MTTINTTGPLRRLDAATVAVADILHQVPAIRNQFGGRTLGGTASIDPGGLVMTGVGTEWLTGLTDSVAPGEWLVAGEQLVKIASVDTNLRLLIEPPEFPATEPGHVMGLADETIHTAATWGRARYPFEHVQLGLPFWTVSLGDQPEHGVAPGRQTSAPVVVVSFVYEEDAGANLLDPGEASWVSTTSDAEAAITATSQLEVLKVPRFAPAGSDEGVRLVQQLVNTQHLLSRQLESNVTAAHLVISYLGLAPGDVIPERW